MLIEQARKYGAVEKLLNSRFEVLHLHRDTRHDWGDDGGYIVAICKKKDLFYLHVIDINYNLALEGLILDEDDWDKYKNEKDAFRDYMIFKTKEEVQEKLISICNELDSILAEEKFSSCLWDDIDSDKYKKEYTDYDKSCLRVMIFAYSEYEQDKIILNNLSKTKYKPNFSDKDERELQWESRALFEEGIIPTKISKKDKKLKLTAERFKNYHSVIEEDFMLSEVNQVKTVAIFIGYGMAKNPKMSKKLLSIANNKGLEWQYVQESYGDTDLFYKDLSDLVNKTEATKARFNIKLMAVEEMVECIIQE